MGNKLVIRTRNVFTKKNKENLHQQPVDDGGVCTKTSSLAMASAEPAIRLERQKIDEFVLTSGDNSVNVLSDKNTQQKDQLSVNEVVDSLGNFSRSNSFCVPDKKLV